MLGSSQDSKLKIFVLARNNWPLGNIPIISARSKSQCNAPDECIALRLCTVNATLLTNLLENKSLLNH